MSEASTPLDQQLAATLRQRRSELRGCMSDLEMALSSPWTGRKDAWTAQVRTALDALARGFQEHIEVNDGTGGLHDELVDAAPRLAGPVAQLTAEHDRIEQAIDELVKHAGQPDTDVAEIRDGGTQVLDLLMRHRQRGADLVFEAYEFDVGGSG